MLIIVTSSPRVAPGLLTHRAWEVLRAHPVLEAARAEVNRRAEVARGYLSRLPEGPARDALSALCDQVVSRST